MKQVPAVYTAMIQTQQRMLYAHLYTFTSSTGEIDYFTDLDIPVLWQGIVYKNNGLRIEGMKMKISVGLNVDEQEVKIDALPTDTLFGDLFFPSVAEGALDGAYIKRSRAIWSVNTGSILADFTQQPFTVIDLFIGRVSTITKIGRTNVQMKLKSPLELLDLDMPRNFYSPGCIWTLYGFGCGLPKANFGTNGTVGDGASKQGIPWSGGVQSAQGPIGGDGTPYYAQGRLLFTSGVLEGQQFLISTNNDDDLYVAYPFLVVPSTGDTFTAFAGCGKSIAACNLKFNNLANIRAYPFVPPVYVAL